MKLSHKSARQPANANGRYSKKEKAQTKSVLKSFAEEIGKAQESLAPVSCPFYSSGLDRLCSKRAGFQKSVESYGSGHNFNWVNASGHSAWMPPDKARNTLLRRRRIAVEEIQKIDRKISSYCRKNHNLAVYSLEHLAPLAGLLAAIPPDALTADRSLRTVVKRVKKNLDVARDKIKESKTTSRVSGVYSAKDSTGLLKSGEKILKEISKSIDSKLRKMK